MIGVIFFGLFCQNRRMGNSKSHDLILREMSQSVRELHYAVMTNDRSTVKNLVADGVNINFPWYNPSNPSVKDGSTPLIIAVSLNHTEIVEVRCSSIFMKTLNFQLHWNLKLNLWNWI